MRPRIYRGTEVALGPGKVALLEAIVENGSIGLAARKLGMSYMRAWTLVQTMNRCFARPLVRTLRGGRAGGRAELTANGYEVLALYQQLVAESRRAGQKLWRQLERRLED